MDKLSDRFKLSADDLKEMLPSGIQSTFVNRIGWASTYMKKAGLLEPTRRGFYKITKRGQDLLKKMPPKIDVKLLKQYPEFQEFQQLKGTKRGDKKSENGHALSIESATPSEALERAYENLRDALADELLAKLRKSTPSFFERIVVELLVKMGYGGSRSDAGKAIGRPDVMQFAGALQAQKATKGIFITTSRFTEDARNYVSQIGSKIVLIDGDQLSELMIEHDVGVSIISLYPVKKIDTDYFNEDI